MKGSKSSPSLCLSVSFVCRMSDLQTTLSLGVLLVHDPLLLSSLLLLSAGLGGLLTLSVGLFQEVLLHTGPVSVSLLLALNVSEGGKKKS